MPSTLYKTYTDSSNGRLSAYRCCNCLYYYHPKNDEIALGTTNIDFHSGWICGCLFVIIFTLLSLIVSIGEDPIIYYILLGLNCICFICCCYCCGENGRN